MLNKFNQFLLAFYISYLALSRFFIGLYPDASFFVLAVPLFTAVGLSVIFNIKSATINWKPIIILLCTVSIFSINFALAGNSHTFSYAYQFMIYGAMPLIFLARIIRFDRFFLYFAYLSIATVALIGLDPVNGYTLTTDYMGYGYFVMLPAYASFYIARKYYKKILFLPLEIATLLLIAVYANQGAILSAIALVILCNLFIDKVSFRKSLILISAAVLTLAILLNIESILEAGVQIAEDNGQSSYSFKKALDSLDSGGDSLSGRSELWQNAGRMFEAQPIFGHGIGAYESKYGIYTHNLFIETAVSFGIIGIMALSVYLANYIRKTSTVSREVRLTYILGIALGIAPLLFSMHVFMWYPFWIFSLNPEIVALATVRRGKKRVSVQLADKQAVARKETLSCEGAVQ